ncbi:MAG: hypothetical protein IAE82_06015 [Opitutaceae bacterium]|nr:hypothetical protein [Opitutaceae bacterium]
MVSETAPLPDDSIDIADLIRRVKRGLPRTLALTLIGVSLGIALTVILLRAQTPVTTLRVAFGFPGAERGAYPNTTKFQPDDVLAPDVINAALQRLGLADSSGELSARLRGSITITGLVSPTIMKERDRLRAAGQQVPPYIPDEYELSLSLPRSHPLDMRQRGLLLTEIVSAYQDKFRRTFVQIPPQFGSAFEQLKNADFVDYELVLNKQMQQVQAYLVQQASQAKQFRSPTSNLSFEDLRRQAELFTQVRMNEVLGLIYLGGLSKDRARAIANMDYQIRILEERELRAKEEESVVTSLLSKTQARAQNYVVAAKSEVPQSPQTILDQGLIDALLANDAYNFLVRRALDAGLAVKAIEAEKALVVERRKRMETFLKSEDADRTAAIARTNEALVSLEKDYRALLENIRVCMEDYARQEYADSVRVTRQAMTKSWLMSIILGAIIGCGIGMPLGLGISLLDLGRRRQAA